MMTKAYRGFSLLLGVLLVASSVVAQDADSDESEAYGRLFASAKVPIWVDLPQLEDGHREPSPADSLPALDADPTVESLRSLGLAMGREVVKRDGAWVFHRSAALLAFEVEDDSLALFGWLSKLNDDGVASVCKGAALGDLDQSGQDFVSRLTRHYPGFQGASTKGAEVKVQLVYAVRVNLTDPKTGQTYETFALNESLDPIKFGSAGPRPTGDKLGQISDGALDFGEGRVATFAEILSTAAETLKVRFVVDRRFYPCKVFVKGRFTVGRLREVLKVYAKAIPADVIAESVDERRARFEEVRKRVLAEIVDQLEGGAMNADLKKELLHGDKSCTGSDAAALGKSVKDYMASKGLGPDCVAKLSRYLMVRVSAKGEHGDVANDVRFGFRQ